ncbi:MAG TPA: tetratricopeptide repeat protein, partial [Gemmatimonadales bacterium]|nr:tetratricopeptide repeat protein [Gemmatimonadales bacterium]
LVADSAGKLQIAFCQLRSGGKVNDGQKLLRTGIEDKDPAKRAASLEQAQAVLEQAITAGGQAESSGAWYYLARTYLARGDVAGADSAFTRTMALAPDCEIDVSAYRQNTWAALATSGIQAMQQGNPEQALTLFRGASTMFRELPHVFENMGVIFANSGMDDSAATYFQQAMEVSRSTLVDNLNSATLNYAAMLQRMEKHSEAIVPLREYLARNPGDMEARKSLAYSFRTAGMVDSADAMERAMVEEFSRMNIDSLSSSELMAVGVSAFNAQQYARAAEIFGKAEARNPWSRDAVYNRANAYLALTNWEMLVEASKRLIEIEPMNEDAYRLLGQGYRGLKEEADSAKQATVAKTMEQNMVKAAEGLVSLPAQVEVVGFRLGASSAMISAVATGREATDAQGRILKPVPVTLVFEFMDAAGSVVAAEEVSIPALQPGQTQDISVQAAGSGISGWRYKRK